MEEIGEVSPQCSGCVKLDFLAVVLFYNETLFLFIFCRADGLDVEILGIEGGICRETTLGNLTG